MSADLPSENELLRWLSEPVEILVIPSHVFVHNANNYPVLSEAHEKVVLQFLRMRTNLAIKIQANEETSLIKNIQYLQFLVAENEKISDPMFG